MCCAVSVIVAGFGLVPWPAAAVEGLGLWWELTTTSPRGTAAHWQLLLVGDHVAEVALPTTLFALLLYYLSLQLPLHCVACWL
jgi:hypothetical protein